MKNLMLEMKKALDEGYIKSDRDRADKYYEDIANSSQQHIVGMLMLKDRAVALYETRYRYACEVIDLIAQELDLDSEGICLYHLKVNETHPVIDRLNNYISNRGNKAELKKEVNELKKENAVLKNLLRG